MKINKLVIRNIASIENGVIDFSSDLIDKSDGLPASLFLITGDTGSGKSVILDCISMCLFGTTPRVAGVNRKTNNKYQTRDGADVAITAIEQYTRLGISHKDDCYTVLSFTGNDGVEYETKFELGYNNRRKFSTPRWTLKIGNETELEKRSNVAPAIQKAIGLSYEQFSRMAMLAQGQFAAFLIGLKEERERILEKLTSTEIFSKYGDGIETLYKRYKAEKESLQTEIKEIQSDGLSQEEEDDLYNSLKDNIAIQSELRETVQLLDGIIKSSEALARYKVREKEVEGLILQSLSKSKVFFDNLQLREANTLIIEKEIAEINSYLESNQRFIPLFKEGAATIERICNLEKLDKELKENINRLDSDRKLLIPLTKELMEIKIQEKEIDDKIAIIQEVIVKLSKEFPSQKGQKIRKEINSIQKLMTSIDSVSDTIENYELLKNENDSSVKLLSLDRDNMKQLKSHLPDLEKKLKQTEESLKKSESLYKSMELSLSENFSRLRLHLKEEEACSCPLCGQHVNPESGWDLDKAELKKILSPLEEVLPEKRKAYDIINKDYQKLLGDINLLTGKINADEKKIKKQRSELSVIAKRIDSQVKEVFSSSYIDLSIDTSEKQEELSVEKNMEQLDELIVRARIQLKEKLAQSEKDMAAFDKGSAGISIQINKRNPLDERKKIVEKSLLKKEKEVAENKERIRSSEKFIISMQKKSDTLECEISESLKVYAPDWKSNIEEVVERLRKESELYENAERRLSELKINLKHSTALIASMKECKIEIECIGRKFQNAQTGILNTDDDNSSISEDVGSASSVSSILEEELSKENERIKLLSDLEFSREWITLLNDFRNHTEELTVLSDSIDALSVELDKKSSEIKYESEDLYVLKAELEQKNAEILKIIGSKTEKIKVLEELKSILRKKLKEFEEVESRFYRWEKLNKRFGGPRFRTLVQSHILKPLLRSANLYLGQISDRFTLTCSDNNEQLAILVADKYNKNEIRSATVLSGGERFMISLALSLALSSMRKSGLNVDILFIDEGFGTLDSGSLNSVLDTLRRLPEIAGNSGRRVGVISHREELAEAIDVKIEVKRCGEGRSKIVIG